VEGEVDSGVVQDENVFLEPVGEGSGMRGQEEFVGQLGGRAAEKAQPTFSGAISAAMARKLWRS
jgi:hypothetical protein